MMEGYTEAPDDHVMVVGDKYLYSDKPDEPRHGPFDIQPDWLYQNWNVAELKEYYRMSYNFKVFLALPPKPKGYVPRVKALPLP